MLCSLPNMLKINHIFMKLQIYNNIAKLGVSTGIFFTTVGTVDHNRMANN